MNDASTNPWAECRRLEAENVKLKRELAAARKVADAAVGYERAMAAYEDGIQSGTLEVTVPDMLTTHRALRDTAGEYLKLKEGK